MPKNQKLSFVIYIAMACVSIAWLSIREFFGEGFAFVAVLLGAAFSLVLLCTDSYVRARCKDMFIFSSAFAVLELIVFLFGFSKNINVVDGIYNFQIVLSIVSIVYFFYIIFRLIMELNNLNVPFVEIMLGNRPKTKKSRKPKELDNGSLEEKPNSKHKQEEGNIQDNVQGIQTLVETDENSEN